MTFSLTEKKKEQVMWYIFLSVLILGMIKMGGEFLGIQLEKTYPVFKFVMLGMPIVLVIVHSFIVLSPIRGSFLLLLSALIGFTAEYLGLKYGQYFGVHYIYRPQITFYTVPVQVLFYWAVFIYIGYSITNYIIKKSPLLLAILSDGLLVLTIDLFMDPLEVKLGEWTWIKGGPYFGIPLGNFLGWFIVAVVVSGIFRSFETYFPEKKKLLHSSIHIIPSLCYGLLTLTFISMAISLEMYEVGVVGSIFMVPIVIYSLYLLYSRRLLQK